ncbi:phosphatidylserine/phosphatidylglycerophosphate/cardiolipin synthase family protein [Aeromicrobium sp.]|uniref:phospholipase D-like domain-containing protein n=1 Tax=Aeromicrobium sp. TaxID=1871063 RepID=UPI0019BE8A5D|nr:phospholipase D-like domain-containing protein [Aeromicrobium sp.]MBC7633868.1 phosphatidylserine/phosphatidylglycerophosphate/cardiolipin synthase family protein [Aeromicrobium sp.]
MSIRRPSHARLLVRRGLLMTLAAQVAAVASLMITTKIRKTFRDKDVGELPSAEPTRHAINDGSAATTYTYGATLFEDMLDAISRADDRILLETYIIKNDAMGRRFRTALVEAAARGVSVHVIYDGFANLVVRRSFFDFPGVEIMKYPVLSSCQLLNPRRIGRDHRKILVIDESVAFVGGYNIGDSYATEWRDTHVKIEGPAVWDLDNAFIDFWNTPRRRLFRRAIEPNHLEPRGTAGWQPQIRAHRNVPRQLMFPIRGMYLEAIDRAHYSIDITAAYFIPDHDILQAILQARRRGVAVRILVPRVSNHVVTDWLSRGFYGDLLRAGVEIHRYRDHMVHAKTATIDGEWSTIGTANIDRLSLTGNYEINLEILDPGLAKGMQEMFEVDLGNSDRLTRREWDERPLVKRIYELILKPLGPLL